MYHTPAGHFRRLMACYHTCTPQTTRPKTLLQGLPYRDPMICVCKNTGCSDGTIGSNSPCNINVGHLIWRNSAMQTSPRLSSFILLNPSTHALHALRKYSSPYTLIIGARIRSLQLDISLLTVKKYMEMKKLEKNAIPQWWLSRT